MKNISNYIKTTYDILVEKRSFEYDAKNMKSPKSYLVLEELSKEIHQYNSILSLLHWDQETYMPSGGITPRSQQISQLSTLIHEKRTSRTFKDHLEKLVSLSTGKPKVKGLTSLQQATVREWRKDFLRLGKLPASFVKTFSQVTSEATQIWATAKKQDQFKLFAPFLERIIDLNRKKAEILGFEDHPYDALLEGYEPCMTTRKIDRIFTDLKKELLTFLKTIRSRSQVNPDFLSKKVSDEKQKEISDWMMKYLPMDLAHTRLDFSSHPFSMALHPQDSRITSRILPHQFMSNIFSILHEAGHSFYEMGLTTKTWGTPMSEPTSLSIHESQSRWWETLIGRSFPFWKYHYSGLKKIVPSLKNISLEKFYRAINYVSPSPIRVEADEVTYCLHIILRFEIEQELISGKLAVHDLPEYWRAKMKEYLGIIPKTDREGCLQDIHWSLGDFGYFPTYALGNLIAAQFFSTFAKKHPDWEERVGLGELGFIRDWLKSEVHIHGRRYNSEELVKKVTKKPLDPKYYCSYLKQKYCS